MRGGGAFRPRLAFSAERRGTAPSEADRFRQVMLPHLDAAYRLARYLSRDSAAAEDIVQEAFLKAYRGFADWRGEAPKAWLLAIVRNCFRDSVAGAAARESHCDIETLSGEPEEALLDRRTPEALLADRNDAAMLRRTIEQLPEPFREALVLRELDELSYREISAVTLVPIGTVMSRLARARQMLTALLLQPPAPAREERQ